jgi:hypothetical protein
MGKGQWMLGAVGLAVILLGVLSYLQGSIAEGFDEKNALQEDLTKMIQSVTKIGKKMLDPEMWNYRIQIMNLSPVELARKQIMLEKGS